ncbi:MAG: carboxypeptidase-like regulatory domain-containing protein, partial [Muribaculaceae bacterium]|nr:carboxypeptidase-like regulatory domain-containing protein [Muribaculaceae bacterium]
FNRIPGVRKLGLREVVGFSGIWGHMADKGVPTVANGLPRFPEGTQMRGLGRTPYMEVSAGIDNIFRILRVDYVWRLSYTDVPYEIDRHGLRVALHFTF